MRQAMKRLMGWIGLMRALPHLMGYALLRPWLGRQRAFSLAGESVAKIPGVLGLYARQAFYRCTAAHVGRDVHFGFMSVLSKPEAVIGDRVYIGRFCGIGWAHLEDDVRLADGVQVLSGRHQHSDQHGESPTFNRVRIGRSTWVGAGAVIMADVGADAVVGAGAVVVKPVPNGLKVGGVPAQPLRSAAASQQAA